MRINFFITKKTNCWLSMEYTIKFIPNEQIEHLKTRLVVKGYT